MTDSPLPKGAAHPQDERGFQSEFQLLRQRYNSALSELSPDALALLKAWPARKAGIRTEQFSYEVRGRAPRHYPCAATI